MRLSKLGLVFLVLYLLWAGYWYSGYLTCPPSSGGGWMLPSLFGCTFNLWLVTFPIEPLYYWIVPKAVPNTIEAIRLNSLVFFFISCAVFYALGAGIGWLARRNNSSVQP